MVIDNAKTLHNSIRAGDDSDDLGVFAHIAFEDRFKLELTTLWQKLEDAAYSSIVAAPVAKKYKPFQKFFEDAEVLLADTIHQYFQRRLNIAIARRQHLGNVSPLDWTKSHMLKDVCAFLGVDENVDDNFEWTSEPREDSRVLSNAERLTKIAELEETSPSTFLLPRWATAPHPAWELSSPKGPSECDAKFEPEGLCETMQWVKMTEFLLGRKIALQIKKDHLDSCIDAGAPGKSVNLILDVATQPGPAPMPMKSPLRKAIVVCWQLHPELRDTDKETYEWLQQNNPGVIPKNWPKSWSRDDLWDGSLPGKTFTKVRKIIKQRGTLSTPITRR